MGKGLPMYQKENSALNASRNNDVSRTTATRTKKADDTAITVEPEKLLDPEVHHPDPRYVGSRFEENFLVDRALEAALKGLAVGNTTMTSVHARICAGRTPSCTRGGPSADTSRAFRARNRCLSHRVAKTVPTGRHVAQTYEHFATLERELKNVQAEEPALFSDPRRIWKWDETCVSWEYGRRIRCYASSSSNNGGDRRSIRD